jgi:hypothetical protein
MQLVAMGAQDVYLTGNPQITFFKVVYRRHTNFSKECIAQQFNGSVPTINEGSVTCTLARNGDLVQEIYLQTTVEANPSDSADKVLDSTIAVYTSATAEFKSTAHDLSAGDTIYFNAIHNDDLTNLPVTLNTRYVVASAPDADTFTLTGITGGTDVAVANAGTTFRKESADKMLDSTSSAYISATAVFKSTAHDLSAGDTIYFNAIHNDDTNLPVTLNTRYVVASAPDADTFTLTGIATGSGSDVAGANADTTFRKESTDKGLSYSYTPAAYTSATAVFKSTDHGLSVGNTIYFNAIHSDDTNLPVTVNTRYVVASAPDADTFTLTGIAAGSGSNVAGANAGTTFKTDAVQLNNNDMTDLIKTVEVEIGGQKIDKHYSQWLDIYNELFETSHDLRFAMTNGSQTAPNVNTKTHYIPLRFWFNRNPGLALPLIALQYHEVKINMTLNPARTAGAVTMSDAKLLVNYLYLDTDERRRFAQVSHEYLIEQVQHTGPESETTVDMNFNHPVKALFWTGSGTGSVALGAAKLQLNGHDRAAEQPHDYYHLVQPYESGLGHSGKSLNNDTRIWGPVVNTGDHNNVGMYSFCLKPAEHQPSGTCNFSRIDNARLNIANVSSANNLYLFAMNYNVLRIMSGMGGLAYSN